MLFVEKSGNAKTGPIAVSYAPRSSCPPSCAFFKNGCYAEVGHTLPPWKRAQAGEEAWARFLGKVQGLPRGAMFRYGVAGDLPGTGEAVNLGMLRGLIDAARGLTAWAYSHKRSPAALRAIQRANRDGLTINLSGNNLADADALAATGAGPVVVVLPKDAEKVTRTPAGRTVVTCPASYRDGVACMTCGGGTPLCARRDRTYIVGFPAHGVRTPTADKVARGRAVSFDSPVSV